VAADGGSGGTGAWVHHQHNQSKFVLSTITCDSLILSLSYPASRRLQARLGQPVTLGQLRTIIARLGSVEVLVYGGPVGHPARHGGACFRDQLVEWLEEWYYGDEVGVCGYIYSYDTTLRKRNGG
jgi:hypothetical protein